MVSSEYDPRPPAWEGAGLTDSSSFICTTRLLVVETGRVTAFEDTRQRDVSSAKKTKLGLQELHLARVRKNLRNRASNPLTNCQSDRGRTASHGGIVPDGYPVEAVAVRLTAQAGG